MTLVEASGPCIHGVLDNVCWRCTEAKREAESAPAFTLEQALDRIQELESMFQRGVPSVRRALDQRDEACAKVEELTQQNKNLSEALRSIADFKE